MESYHLICTYLFNCNNSNLNNKIILSSFNPAAKLKIQMSAQWDKPCRIKLQKTDCNQYSIALVFTFLP